MGCRRPSRTPHHPSSDTKVLSPILELSRVWHRAHLGIENTKLAKPTKVRYFIYVTMSDVDTKGTEQDDELIINDVYLQCLDSFMSCSDCLHLSAASRQLVNDEMSRFKIWAANIGAHLDSSIFSSLDHRLRNSEKTKTSVILLLRVIRVNIDYGTCFSSPR
jgi:hypothetical protein